MRLREIDHILMLVSNWLGVIKPMKAYHSCMQYAQEPRP